MKVQTQEQYVGRSCLISPACRGAIGFGAGSVVALLGLFLWPNAPPWKTIVPLAGLISSGAIGGATLDWGRKSRHSPLMTAIGFAIGFLVLVLVTSYTFPGIERPHRKDVGIFFLGLLYCALNFGFGFALAGGIGAAFMRLGFRFALLGAEVFAIGGVIGSSFFWTLFLFLGDRWPVANSVGFCIGTLTAYSFGGGYLGAALDSLEKKKAGVDDL